MSFQKSNSDADNTVQILDVTQTSVGSFIPMGNLVRRQVATKIGLKMKKISKLGYVGGLHKDLASRPKVTQNVSGSGQCLFNAASFSIYGDELRAQNIRVLVCMFIMDPAHWDNLKALCHPCTTGEEYVRVKDMRNPATWGTEVEMQALAMLCGIDVCVYENGRWHRYYSRNINSPTTQSFYFLLECGHFQVVMGM